MERPIRTALIGGFCLLLAACGSSTAPGAAPGESCQIDNTQGGCPAHAAFCYAAGSNSSCSGGDLCTGNGSGMTCAYSCSQDSDCASQSPSAKCLQDCLVHILNGYCVEPETQTRLMSRSCTHPSEGEADAVGVAGYSTAH